MSNILAGQIKLLSSAKNLGFEYFEYLAYR